MENFTLEVSLKVKVELGKAFNLNLNNTNILDIILMEKNMERES